MSAPTPPATSPPTAPPPQSPGATAADVRPVLRIPAFRHLWTALALSSFGDWLGLLALTSLATALAGGSYTTANLAVASVFILRLAPAILFGPIAGVVADRLDRRATMVACDMARFLLFASIPLVGTLWWLLVATFLIEVAAMFWIPAKEATVPNLVPRSRLEAANQVSLLATYGTAPIAALVFASLALLTGILDNTLGVLDPVDLALWFNALTFLFSALTIWRLRDIPAVVRDTQATGRRPTVWHTVTDGWRFVVATPIIRGLIVGMLGAFAAGGAVVGLARTYVGDLGAGDPGYGVLFGAVFLGMAAGLGLGPRLFAKFSRRRLFGLSIGGAGISLGLLALVPNMVMAALFTVMLGAWTGIAWVTGYTLIGLEVEDEMRGRTFAFVQTMTRITLVAVLAVAPLIAAAIGRHSISFTDARDLTYNGAAITYLLAALLAIALGIASYRQMDDRHGIPLLADLAALVKGVQLASQPASPPAAPAGFLVALEGGEGAGKTTQLAMLEQWLTEKGHEVVLTHEPGATAVGRRLRELLLDPETTGLSPRAEALLYAADRAQHVDSVIAPALERGAVVVTDRFVDSSVAYQGAGRTLSPEDVARISQWATSGLVPDVTIVLDIAPEVGLFRSGEPADRLEAEPLAFHRRVRQAFLSAAARHRDRYLVIDASLHADEITARIRKRLSDTLPPSQREIRKAEAEMERRRAEQEAAAARAEQARREVEAQVEEGRRRAEQARREMEAQAEAEHRRAAQARREVEAQAEMERLRAEQEAAAARAEQARREAEATQARADESQRPPPEQPRRTEAVIQLDETPTREMSLLDEIFSLGSDDDTVETRRQDRR